MRTQIDGKNIKTLIRDYINNFTKSEIYPFCDSLKSFDIVTKITLDFAIFKGSTRRAINLFKVFIFKSL